LKVLDAKSGMILAPSENKYTKIKGFFALASTTVENFSNKKNEEINIAYVQWGDNSKIIPSQLMGIYMGYEYSDFWLSGVKKHHMILIDGILCKLNGYEFRYIESVT